MRVGVCNLPGNTSFPPSVQQEPEPACLLVASCTYADVVIRAAIQPPFRSASTDELLVDSWDAEENWPLIDPETSPLVRCPYGARLWHAAAAVFNSSQRLCAPSRARQSVDKEMVAFFGEGSRRPGYSAAPEAEEGVVLETNGGCRSAGPNDFVA